MFSYIERENGQWTDRIEMYLVDYFSPEAPKQSAIGHWPLLIKILTFGKPNLSQI